MKKSGNTDTVMRYPVAIEPGDEGHAFGAVIPDLPGCFSAGDTLDEAITNAEQALLAWIEATLDAGGAIPSPSALETLCSQQAFSGWIWAVVSVDLDDVDLLPFVRERLLQVDQAVEVDIKELENQAYAKVLPPHPP